MASQKNAARGALLTRVRTAWLGAGKPAATIAWPNTTFAPPPIAEGACWVRPTILWGSTFEVAVGTGGAGLNFAGGLLDLAIFTAPSAGDGLAHALADTLADAFNRLDLRPDGTPSPNAFVRLGSADGPAPLGDDGSGWMGVSVQIPFQVEEAV